jgi:hypothetical protein
MICQDQVALPPFPQLQGKVSLVVVDRTPSGQAGGEPGAETSSAFVAAGHTAPSEEPPVVA